MFGDTALPRDHLGGKDRGGWEGGTSRLRGSLHACGLLEIQR